MRADVSFVNKAAVRALTFGRQSMCTAANVRFEPEADVLIYLAVACYHCPGVQFDTEGMMILRQFRVTIHEGMEGEFERVFRDEILPMVKSHAGLEWVAAGKPWKGEQNVFCMTMLWRDLDAIKGFAGPNWNTARIEPEEAHLIKSTELEHFELLGSAGPEPHFS